ncbi:MAG: cytochrome-c peroxidase [Betaproteobacteria bacterium]|nr:cytochrome-c peroxidase [Betaproteobacteria bacterium]
MRIVAAVSLAFVATTAQAALAPLPAMPPVPADSPMSAAKVALGKQLFFDPRLSLDGTVSCASCHDVVKGGGNDGRATAIGVAGKTGSRNAPTVWNAAFLNTQFWDGRAASLEEQAKGPMINPVEMAMPSHNAVIQRLKKIPGYSRQFAAVFGDRDPLTLDNVVRAIAAYERTLLTPDSPVDRFLKGDKQALTAQAQRGMKLFQDLRCVSCHSSPTYAGYITIPGALFYPWNLQRFPFFKGSIYDAKYELTKDLGRYEVTKQEKDKHMYRIPSLRNVDLTGPYMHNGKVPNLEEAVRVMAKTQLNKELRDEEAKAIVAFLKGLTGRLPKQDKPRLPADRQ